MSQEFFVRMRVTSTVNVRVEADDEEDAIDIAEGLPFDDLVDLVLDGEDFDCEVVDVDDEDLSDDTDDEDSVEVYLDEDTDEDV